MIKGVLLCGEGESSSSINPFVRWLVSVQRFPANVSLLNWQKKYRRFVSYGPCDGGFKG